MEYILTVGGYNYEIKSESPLECTFPYKQVEREFGSIGYELDRSKSPIYTPFDFTIEEDILWNQNPYALIELKCEKNNLSFKLHNAQIIWMDKIDKVNCCRITFTNLEVS